MLNIQNITALRMERLHFINKADLDNGYDELFRDISPVPTIYWSSPGEAPSLPLHTDFNDVNYNNKRRAVRKIIKGRFQKGQVGYVEAAEQELFAALYVKPIERFTLLQSEIIDLLKREGPMSVQYMKKMTGRLVKELSPALQSLQQAYIVFEDQVDNEWDRAWYLLEGEFPDFNINKYNKAHALDTVLMRFAKRIVAFDADMVKSYYKLTPKEISGSLKRLVEKGSLVKTDFGYIRSEDLILLNETNFGIITDFLLVLHRNDFLVKVHEHILQKKYKLDGFKTLQYILINGEFKGAVFGHFRFSPNEIEDVILDVTDKEAIELREKIIDGIYKVNSYESPVKKYCGKEI